MSLLKALLYVAMTLGLVAAATRIHGQSNEVGRMKMPWSYDNENGFTFDVDYEVHRGEGLLLHVAFVIISDQHLRYGAPDAPDTLFTSSDFLNRYGAATYQFEPRGFNHFFRVPKNYLTFMTIENAVRDIETFITDVVLAGGPVKNIIVMGTGYGGQLAAYYNAAFSRASAAIVDTARVYTPATYPLYAYLKETLSPGCFAGWGDVVAHFDGLIAEGGSEYVGGDFLMCHYTDLDDAEWTAFMWHSVFFPVANALGFTYSKRPIWHATRSNICRRLEKPIKTQWNEFRDIVKLDLRPEGRYCLATDYMAFGDEFYNGYLASMTAHQCLGMGQFAVAEAGAGMPVDIPLKAMYKACQALLGEGWDPKIIVEGTKKITKQFGGRDYVGNYTFAANAKGDVYYPLTPRSAGDKSVVLDYDGSRGSLFAKPASSDTQAVVETRSKMFEFIDSILL
jgi:pimeloyl-ACP methyl ester carboxylesterase